MVPESRLTQSVPLVEAQQRSCRAGDQEGPSAIADMVEIRGRAAVHGGPVQSVGGGQNESSAAHRHKQPVAIAECQHARPGDTKVLLRPLDPVGRDQNALAHARDEKTVAVCQTLYIQRRTGILARPDSPVGRGQDQAARAGHHELVVAVSGIPQQTPPALVAVSQLMPFVETRIVPWKLTDTNLPPPKATESTEAAPDWAGLPTDHRTPLDEYRITPSPPAATNVP